MWLSVKNCHVTHRRFFIQCISTIARQNITMECQRKLLCHIADYFFLISWTIKIMCYSRFYLDNDVILVPVYPYGGRPLFRFLCIYDIKLSNIALNISFPNSRPMSKLVLMCTLFFGPCHIYFPVQYDRWNFLWWTIVRYNPICDVLFSARKAYRCLYSYACQQVPSVSDWKVVICFQKLDLRVKICHRFLNINKL